MKHLFPKKILKNNSKTKAYLDSLPKVYLIACWARYGVREYPFSGKFNKNYEPLVYDYNDHNGMCDRYELVPISYTTTGFIKDWTFSKSFAYKCAELFNKEN